MKGVEQVFDYRFPTDRCPIAGLRSQISELADRFGLNVESWNEDGLGKLLGVLLKLPSKRIVALIEYETYNEAHRLEHGTLEVSLGAEEVAALGAEPLIGEVLECLGLTRDDLIWLATEAVQMEARDLLRHM
ncbi:hypothetical protein RAD15_41115 [Bradyrhizobium sp. 14AA]